MKVLGVCLGSRVSFIVGEDLLLCGLEIVV